MSEICLDRLIVQCSWNLQLKIGSNKHPCPTIPLLWLAKLAKLASDRSSLLTSEARRTVAYCTDSGA